MKNTEESPIQEGELHQLFTALYQESAWSSGYEVSSGNDGCDYLSVHHSDLPFDQVLLIRDGSLSVEDVRKLMMSKWKSLKDATQISIDILQRKANHFGYLKEKIEVDLCLSTVRKVAGENVNFTYDTFMVRPWIWFQDSLNKFVYCVNKDTQEVRKIKNAESVLEMLKMIDKFSKTYNISQYINEAEIISSVEKS